MKHGILIATDAINNNQSLW